MLNGSNLARKNYDKWFAYKKLRNEVTAVIKKSKAKYELKLASKVKQNSYKLLHIYQ